MNINIDPPISSVKFRHPDITAKGEERATVAFEGFQTLWFNTGSLCNIECANCYIESGPQADHFVYLTPEDVTPYLNELDGKGEPIEIGLTGGEPFMNPDIIKICDMALARGHILLILTNAMRPMMRPQMQAGLKALQAKYGPRINVRVSLDHYTAARHDEERGIGSFAKTLTGMNWLRDQGIQMTIAGRTMWGEDEPTSRNGFAQLITRHGWKIDASHPGDLVLFPEMDERTDVPEITTACWDILSVSPSAMMCASSRMVVKRKGGKHAAVLPCTLLWNDAQFEMGATLASAQTPVSLNHPHCAKFCVLGGASCSA